MIAAPWKSAEPARYIDAPRGSTRSATASDTPSARLASSRVTGRAAAVLVVEKAIEAAPNVPVKKRTGPIPPTTFRKGRYTTPR